MIFKLTESKSIQNIRVRDYKSLNLCFILYGSLTCSRSLLNLKSNKFIIFDIKLNCGFHSLIQSTKL